MYLHVFKARESDIVKKFGYEGTNINAVIFSTNCNCWKSYLLNRVVS
jgi:hypothetical protein